MQLRDAFHGVFQNYVVCYNSAFFHGVSRMIYWQSCMQQRQEILRGNSWVVMDLPTSNWLQFQNYITSKLFLCVYFTLIKLLHLFGRYVNSSRTWNIFWPKIEYELRNLPAITDVNIAEICVIEDVYKVWCQCLLVFLSIIIFFCAAILRISIHKFLSTMRFRSIINNLQFFSLSKQYRPRK